MNKQQLLSELTTQELLTELKKRPDLANNHQIISDLEKEISQQRQIIKAAYTTLHIYQRVLKEIQPDNSFLNKDDK